MLKRLTDILCLIFAGILCVSCHNTRDERKSVVVTIPPIAAVASEIAGDSLDVFTLLDKSGDPENYEPGLRDIKKVCDADAFISTGLLPIEENLLGKLNSGGDKVKVFDLSEGIDLLRGTHQHCTAHHHHHHENNLHDNTADPHYWTSVENMKIIAGEICRAFSQIDAENQDYYVQNLRRLENRLDSLQLSMNNRMEPVRGQAFLIMHPSLSYFADNYGLTQISVGGENKELSILNFKEAIDDTNGHKALIFIEDANISRRQTENIRKEIDIPIHKFNSLSPDWETELENLTDAINRAFNSAD